MQENHNIGPKIEMILASASPARLTTLRNAGVFPSVMVSEVDESEIISHLLTTDPAATAETQVSILAQAKAKEVAHRLLSTPPEISTTKAAMSQAATSQAATSQARRIVVGCDSMLEVAGKLLGKPRDSAQAISWIKQLSGSTVVLHTGHCVIDLAEPDQIVAGVSATKVHFSQLSDPEIKAYVATGEPLRVAGAFTIDGLGGPFISGVTGDHHGVIGLSLPLLRELLQRLGITWTDLWDF